MYLQDLNRIIEVYSNARSTKTGEHFTTINELTDQLPATRPDTLMAAARSLISLGPLPGDKVLCEEDKGAILGGAVSLLASKALAMARWYPYELPTSIKVPLKMEYYEGTLYVNGVEEGDRLVVIDDTLSSGGTILALAKAVYESGAQIVDVRVVVEKLGNGGRSRVKEELGVDVKSVIGIRIDDNGQVGVEEVLGRPIASDRRRESGRPLGIAV